MANLYEVLAEAQNGEAMSELGQRIWAFAPANPGCGGMRFCPQYRWALSERRPLLKVLAICSP